MKWGNWKKKSNIALLQGENSSAGKSSLAVRIWSCPNLIYYRQHYTLLLVSKALVQWTTPFPMAECMYESMRDSGNTVICSSCSSGPTSGCGHYSVFLNTACKNYHEQELVPLLIKWFLIKIYLYSALWGAMPTFMPEVKALKIGIKARNYLSLSMALEKSWLEKVLY